MVARDATHFACLPVQIRARHRLDCEPLARTNPGAGFIEAHRAVSETLEGATCEGVVRSVSNFKGERGLTGEINCLRNGD